MTRLLCASPRCLAPGRHHTDCPREQCAGCQPRQAADGAYLCPLHTARIGEDAQTIGGTLYHDLSLMLRNATAAGQRVSGSSTAVGINDDAAEARKLIRHVLVSWVKLICDVRGVHPPAGHLTLIGAFISRHHTWLAAQTFAGDCSAELHDLAYGTYGCPHCDWRVSCRRTAYPTGARVGDLKHGCPLCPGHLKAIMRPQDSLLPHEVCCDGEQPHRWDSTQWRQLDRLVAKVAA